MQIPIYPQYPNYPSFPNQVSFPQMPEIPQNGKTGIDNLSLKNTFSNVLSGVSEEMKQPYILAEEMASGKKPLDTAELMISILEAEKKLNVTVRVVNELVKSLKTLETLQI